MDIPEIEGKLRVLRHYRALGERLMDLLEADEKIPGSKDSVCTYLDLMIQEIDILQRRKQLILAHPEYANRIPAPTPEQNRKLTLSQIELYNKYIALGMPEDDAIRLSLDPRAAMFNKFDNLAIIYGIH